MFNLDIKLQWQYIVWLCSILWYHRNSWYLLGGHIRQYPTTVTMVCWVEVVVIMVVVTMVCWVDVVVPMVVVTMVLWVDVVVNMVWWVEMVVTMVWWVYVVVIMVVVTMVWWVGGGGDDLAPIKVLTTTYKTYKHSWLRFLSQVFIYLTHLVHDSLLWQQDRGQDWENKRRKYKLWSCLKQLGSIYREKVSTTNLEKQTKDKREPNKKLSSKDVYGTALYSCVWDV